jgi:hypothetical protein
MSKQLDKKILSNIHFINIDKRTIINGYRYAILENGQNIHIPNSIQKVPALILINEGNNILFGNSIYQYYGLNLMFNQQIQTREQINQYNDPEPFTFEGHSSSNIGITSDKYSFLDISSDDMMAQGRGGISQLHTYITLNDYENGNLRIDAKEDDGNDIKSNVSLSELQEQRAKDIQLKTPPQYDQLKLPSYN